MYISTKYSLVDRLFAHYLILEIAAHAQKGLLRIWLIIEIVDGAQKQGVGAQKALRKNN